VTRASGGGEGRRAAVLGHPIAHSLSPVLHRAAYASLGLTGWSYEAIDVDEAGLPGFFAELDGDWAGLSLTMPLKRAVRPLLVAESPLAEAVAAVNTVTFTPAGPVGDNTDVPGIVAALRESGIGQVGRSAVLGGGATATSAVAALQQLGCDRPIVHVRRLSTTADLRSAAERLGARPVLAGLDPDGLAGLAGIDLVISTLPGTAADSLAEPLVAAARTADRSTGRAAGAPLPVLMDVVYAPWPTGLAVAWTQAGGRAVGGFALLLHQAAEQVRLMTGRPAPLEAMRRAGEAELARRALRAGTVPPGSGSLHAIRSSRLRRTRSDRQP
jgi:shikimate dehydrogenase